MDLCGHVQVCTCDKIKHFEFVNELAMTKTYFFALLYSLHKHAQASENEADACCQSKTPFAEKITLHQPLPHTQEWKSIWKLFFPICFSLSRLSNTEYQSLAAPWHYSWHSGSSAHSGGIRTYWKKFKTKSTWAMICEGWRPVLFFFFFPRPLFLFKPGVILWVQFNIWEEGGIWIFIILW